MRLHWSRGHYGSANGNSKQRAARLSERERIIETRLFNSGFLKLSHAIVLSVAFGGVTASCADRSSSSVRDDVSFERRGALTAGAIVVGPAGQSISSNQTLQLSATVTGLTSPAVTWRIDWGGGSITQDGRYTAPSIAGWGEMQISAVSAVDSSVSGQVKIEQVPGVASAPAPMPMPTATSAPTPAPMPPSAPMPSPSPMPSSGGTAIGWIPCAPQGETCSLPAGTAKVLYGKTPDPGGSNSTKTFQGVTSILCDSSTFGGNPNPTGWETNFCWVEGPIAPILPADPEMGMDLTLPLVVPGFPGFSKPRVEAATVAVSQAVDVSSFRDECGFAKFSFNDPIVFPGKAQMAHLHLFFGNTDVDEKSTAASIQTSGGSTCSGGTLNRSAYWVPAMIDMANQQPVRPTLNNVYYKSGYNGIKPAAITPVPPGLMMITGSASNTQPGVNPAGYACVSDADVGAWQPNIPDCPVGYDLVMEVTFPQCWDGVHLDSSDHKSHMSNTVNGACPSDHPVPIPVVSYNIHYPITTAHAAAHYRLSSDHYDVSNGNAGYSAHADYMYGWDAPTMKTFITRCLNDLKDCHDFLLGDGTTLF